MGVIVVKIGGSLSQKPQELKVLCEKLSILARKYALVVVPGGAGFADCVRMYDRSFSLSPVVTHRMAILGMDQYGLLLSSFFSNCRIVDELDEIKSMHVGELAIFLPSKYMFEVDPLENSWDVTSDSIAGYIAGKLCSEKVLLVKDVDGIFTGDPKKMLDGKLIRHLYAQQLLELNKSTSVDVYLPKVLLKSKVRCYIVNGLYPERIEDILEGKETVCSVIS